MMRSIVFFAACIVASTIAFAEFRPAEAQQQFQAPQGEARRQLILRALGISQSSAMTQIAEVTPSQPVVYSGSQRVAWLSAWRPESWMPDSSVTIEQANPVDGVRSALRLNFRALPGVRHLVICDIERHPAFDIQVHRNDVVGPGFAWETPTRGALVIAPASGTAWEVALSFSIPDAAPVDADFHLSRCEISAISA